MSDSSKTEKISVVFTRDGIKSQVETRPGSKLLVAAIKNKIEIRYGCSACRCGTCGVAVQAAAPDLKSSLSEMTSQEKDLLEKMSLPLDGSVRLACQARVLASGVEADLSFQSTYSPDDALEDEDDYYDDEY